MNRFFDIEGDVSTQLAPWKLKAMGYPVDHAQYKLKEKLRMRSDIAGGVLVVYPGRISDLASIPRPVWSIMPPTDPRIALGAWFHDELYKCLGSVMLECGKIVHLTRKQSDQILAFEAMPDLMADRWQQHAVYQAVLRFAKPWPGESFLYRFK
jgi:Protein of unknown function (DUF1353)